MRFTRTTMTLGIASALALGAAAGAKAHQPGEPRQGGPAITGYPHPGMSHGMMGYGMMGTPPHQGILGHGMMGGGYGPGPMGPGYGYGPMHPGMGYGMGPNTLPGGPAYGPGPRGPAYGEGPMYPGLGRGMGPGIGPDQLLSLPEDLTAEQVRHMFEHRLEWHQNPNLQIGEVTQPDEDTIMVDVVTRDGSLVQRFAVDPHTGQFRPAEQQQ